MAIKIVACDVDGTLINKDNVLTEKVTTTIKKVSSKGVKFCIATGRMFCSAQVFAKELQLDTPLISYNGALIKNAKSQNVYNSNTLDIDVAKDVLQMCKVNNWHVQKYVGDCLSVKVANEKAQYYSSRIKVPLQIEGEDFYKVQEAPNKLMLIVEPKDQQEIMAQLKKNFADKVHITSSNDRFIEVITPGVNKGVALKYLADLYGFLPEEIMACGDSYNDIEMLEFAGLSVVMDNANDEVKKHADFITKSCNEDGVAHALERFCCNE